MLQGEAGIIIESLINLDKEFGYYPKSNGTSLKSFKQGKEMMRLVFRKDRFDCSMKNGSGR